jgi:hypothetical protein
MKGVLIGRIVQSDKGPHTIEAEVGNSPLVLMFFSGEMFNGLIRIRK